jgi:hypothetical protein
MNEVRRQALARLRRERPDEYRELVALINESDSGKNTCRAKSF